MSSDQQWTGDSSGKASEGVPLLQTDQSNKTQQQQPPQSFDPSLMMVPPPPGSYGSTSGYPMGGPSPPQYDGIDPAVAEAAAAAMQYQMMMQNQSHQGGGPGTPPQPYYFQGYPGGGPPPPGGGTLPPGYPVPPPMQYMQFYPPFQQQAQQQQQQQQQQRPRPPRHARRRSDGKSSSPSPSPPARVKKTFQPPPQQQRTIEQHTVQSAIPPLQDIFAPEIGGSSGGSNNNNQTNYGSMNNNNVYNAPPRIPKMQPVLVRTNSSQDMASSSKRKLDRPLHRRSNSDTPLRLLQKKGGNHKPPMHRRTNSGNPLRGRTYSTDSVTGSKRGHRRIHSDQSFQTYSSAISQSSVRSNISKSAMFGGVDEGGRVQLHFPKEALRLEFLSDEDYQKKNALTRGHLYQYRNISDYDQFDEYIRLTEDLEQGITPQWESLGGMAVNNPLKACNCTCNNCNGCLGKRQLLPDTNYALPVSDSVYKRVVGEIADAHSMPCGLFFCGHHEDVAHPSITIAVTIVSFLMVGLIYAAFVTDFLT